MKKIVLVGELRSLNLGDSVIFFVFHSLLAKFYSGDIITLDISDYRNSPNMVSKFIRMINNHYDKFADTIAYPYMRIKSAINIPSNSYVCFIGGALFQNYFINSLKAITKSARKKNCTTDFFSLGIGPLSERNKHTLLSIIKEDGKNIFTVRDGFHFWDNFKKNYIKQPDIATCSSLIYSNKVINKDKVLGIGVISFSTYKQTFPRTTLNKTEYIQSLCRLIKTAVKNNFTVELFCNGDPGDYEEAYSIKDSIKDVMVNIAPRPITHYELVERIKGYSFVVASRLHALIISYSFCIPFFAVGWDPKVDDWLTLIQRTDLGKKLEDIYTINWEDILATKKLYPTDLVLLKKFQNVLIERLSILAEKNYDS